MAEPQRLPLSHDVLSVFQVIYTLPVRDGVPDPSAASLTVCRMPDGRYVLVEMSGSVGAVIGEPVTLADAIAIAQRQLAAGGEYFAPADARGIALAFVGLMCGTARAAADACAHASGGVYALGRLPAARGAP